MTNENIYSTTYNMNGNLVVTTLEGNEYEFSYNSEEDYEKAIANFANADEFLDEMESSGLIH